MLTAYGFSRYGAEPVEPISTFVHVLNLPESEDIWPGEWVNVFPQQYCSAQHVGTSREELLTWSVWQYQRMELMRICRAHFPEGSHNVQWERQFMFDSLMVHGTIDFCDDCADDITEYLIDEVWWYETLHAEINKYVNKPPYMSSIGVESQALDESIKPSLQCPVEPILPTEQEDN